MRGESGYATFQRSRDSAERTTCAASSLRRLRNMLSRVDGSGFCGPREVEEDEGVRFFLPKRRVQNRQPCPIQS